MNELDEPLREPLDEAVHDPATAASGRSLEEVEWQFDADDLDAVEAWLRECSTDTGIEAAPAGQALMRDRYLDTDDWRAYRAGTGLRLRDMEQRAEATLKAFGQASGALRRRREWNELLVAADEAVLRQSPGPVGTRVRALVGDRPLRELFTVRTFRRRYALRDGSGRVLGELALDDSAFTVDGAAAEPPEHEGGTRLARIEVETAPGVADAVDRLAPFVERLTEAARLRPAADSKLARGLVVAGLAPPAAATEERMGRRTTAGAFARAALRGQLAAILANESGTRLGEDIEALHDMRVATRRMRTAVRLFRDLLPPEWQPLREELRWLAAALGEVRDIDVQVERLDATADEVERAALEPLRALLLSRRERARVGLLAALDDTRYVSLVDTATRLLETPPEEHGPAGKPATRVLPALLRAQWRRFERRADALGPDDADEALHDVRVRAKRVRYAIEFVQPIYGRRAARARTALVALQDHLGAHQDATVAIEQMRALARDEGERLPPETLLAMGERIERMRAGMRGAREAYPRARRRAAKRWRRLERRLDAGR